MGKEDAEKKIFDLSVQIEELQFRSNATVGGMGMVERFRASATSANSTTKIQNQVDNLKESAQISDQKFLDQKDPSKATSSSLASLEFRVGELEQQRERLEAKVAELSGLLHEAHSEARKRQREYRSELVKATYDKKDVQLKLERDAGNLHAKIQTLEQEKE